MEWTRHARNRLRWHGIARAEVEALVAAANQIEPDPDGNPRFDGVIRGNSYRVVVALDNPSLIITIIDREKT